MRTIAEVEKLFPIGRVELSERVGAGAVQLQSIHERGKMPRNCRSKNAIACRIAMHRWLPSVPYDPINPLNRPAQFVIPKFVYLCSKKTGDRVLLSLARTWAREDVLQKPWNHVRGREAHNFVARTFAIEEDDQTDFS